MTEKDKEWGRAIAGNLALVLLIATAVDAAGDRRTELIEKLHPLVQEYGDPSTNPARVKQLIRYMMDTITRTLGEDWEMHPDYRKAIADLLGT